MSELTTIFRKFEVIGNTKDAAMKESGLNLRVDATQAYKKWAKENAVTEDAVTENEVAENAAAENEVTEGAGTENTVTENAVTENAGT